LDFYTVSDVIWRKNDLKAYERIFDSVTPWAGTPPSGYSVDFLGTLTNVSLFQHWRGDISSIGGRRVQTSLPVLDNMGMAPNSFETVEWRGERWFEAVNWFVAAAHAREKFVMITLGAWHGSQAVGSYRALQRLNPMPSKLVAVEPVPENLEMTRRHFRDNGIDPDDHWFIPMALSNGEDPVLFAIGPRQMGAQNCVSTNELEARESYCRQIIETRKTEQALYDLLLRNRTGIVKSSKGLVPGDHYEAEIRFVSAITLNEVLGPFDRIDYLESDIQQSEILAFPPFMDLLKKKVRRIHIGTHGQEVHNSLRRLFETHAWEVIFDYEPDTTHVTVLGEFRTDDGVLTVRNPSL
jgi:hypothetical protein